MKTALFLSHRIREAMKELDIENTSPQLGGESMVVEADESYVGGKGRNRKNHVPEKHAVFSLVERGGRVRSFHLPEVNGKTLKPILQAHIDMRTHDR